MGYNARGNTRINVKNSTKNSARNRGMEERRAGRRKREQAVSRLVFLITVAVILMLAFEIRNVNAELEGIRGRLKQIEALQYGSMENSEETAPPAAEAEGTDDIRDYTASIHTVNIEKPLDRTWAETLQKLEELGEGNPDIAAISKSSSQYPQALLVALANNPEMADFVMGYPGGSAVAAGGLTDLEKEQEYPLLLQWDPRWGYEPYGDGSCVGLSGCGPTCLSMMLYYLTKDETLTPDRIAAYSIENGYYVNGTGTAWALMEDFPAKYHIKVTTPGVTERAMKVELDNGNILVCAMGKGDFTVAGHFIVLYGYDENGFLVNDPNCVARSRKRWTFEEIKGQIKKIWAYGNEKNKIIDDAHNAYYSISK